MAETPVIIPIRATDGASSVFDKIGKNLESFSRNFGSIGKDVSAADSLMKGFGKSSQSIGNGLMGVGAVMTAGITVPVAAMGLAAVKTAGDFEESLNDLRFRIRGSDADIAALTEKARLLGTTTVFSAQDAAAAMIILGKNGFKTGQILSSTQSALNLAIAEGVTPDESARMITNTLTVFGKSADEAESVADILGMAAGESSISLLELEQSMKHSASGATKFKLNLEDLAGSISALGQIGIRGESAGTALKSLFTTIGGDADRQQKLIDAGMKSDGSDFFTDAEHTQLRPIHEILKAISGAKLKNTEITEIFGKEFGLLISKAAEDFDLFTTKVKAMGDANGYTMEAAKAKSEGWNGAIKRLDNSWKDLHLEIMSGEGGPLQAMTSLAESLRGLTTWFRELSPETKSFMKWSVGIAALMGPIIGGIGLLAGAIGGVATMFGIAAAVGVPLAAVMWSILWPVMLIGAGIAMLVTGLALFASQWEEKKAFYIGLWDFITDIFSYFPTGLAETFDAFFGINQAQGVIAGSSSATATGNPLMAKQTGEALGGGQTRKDDLILTLNGFPANTEVKEGAKNESNLSVDRGFIMPNYGALK